MTDTKRTSPLTTEELDELEELEAEATKAPWCVHPNGTSVWTGDKYDSSGEGDAKMVLQGFVNDSSWLDLELVAALRNAAPGLLGAARDNARLREALDLSRTGHEDWCKKVTDCEPDLFDCDCGSAEHNARIDAALKESTPLPLGRTE